MTNNKISEEDWSLSGEQRQEITTATGKDMPGNQVKPTHNTIQASTLVSGNSHEIQPAGYNSKFTMNPGIAWQTTDIVARSSDTRGHYS